MNADDGVTVSFFQNFAAKEKEERTLTLAEFGELVRTTTARTKGDLPWVKLAKFGDRRSDKGTLRIDANVLSITGIEADYDGEKVWFYRAVEIAEKAGLAAILYTSPSHTPEKPRWRILCPASEELPPARRSELLAWLHGLYAANVEGGGDVFAAESWTLSQSYYFGCVKRSAAHRVRVVEGEPIDRLSDLAAIARGKPQTQTTGRGNGAAPSEGAVDEAALIELIRTGANYHNAAIRLIGHWARSGLAARAAEDKLIAAFETVFPPDRDQRWRDRVADIPNLIVHVYGKDAEAQTRRDRVQDDYEDDHPAPGAPIDDADTGWGAPLPEARWPQLDEAALHGLAGEVVQAIAPHTESDPAAILTQFLTMVGSAIGRGPFYRVEGDSHYLNLYLLLVGNTSKARKGTSAGRVRQVMRPADSDWERQRIMTGLSTGEGLIWPVRDEIREMVKTGKGENAKYEEQVTDPGIADKRLLVMAGEFSRTLVASKREGNTLDAVLREAWDSGKLGIMTKSQSARTTNAHISIIGHITLDELRRRLDTLAMTNGFANRFLFVCVKRAQLLPFGGSLASETLLGLADHTHFAIEAARRLERVAFSPAAAELWETEYPLLSAEHPGIFGGATARSEAQTVRLATLYAALDGSAAIEPVHLAAGLALWRYCEASALYIFGDTLGEPDADEILRLLRARPDGMTRTELYNFFGRSRSADRIGAALELLAQHGKARFKQRATGGRPVEIWVAA